MSTQLRTGPTTSNGATPPARRLSSARWRDPRLAVGVVLVAGSVVLGSQVLASADDTTPIWSVRTDRVAGSPLSGDAVQVGHVRLDDGSDAAVYLSGDEPFPTGMVAAHDLSAGELVSRSDVRVPGERSGAELPVAVQDGHRPTDLAAGDLVDVWVAPGPAPQASKPARQVLTAVEVLAVDATGGGIGGGSAVVLLGLGQSDSADLPATLSAVTSGTVVLVRVERPE